MWYNYEIRLGGTKEIKTKVLPGSIYNIMNVLVIFLDLGCGAAHLDNYRFS